MPPKTFKIKPKVRPPVPEPTVEWVRPAEWPAFPRSLGEEVEWAVVEWYGRRGLPVPAEEVGVGTVIDRAEAEQWEAAAVAAQAAAAAEAAAPAGEKPEFGTPAFWAWARKRKLEKEKEAAAAAAARAAAGLPPLPEKKKRTPKQKATS